MSTVTTPSPIRREPELLGQTVVVIGGSAGIGLETARRARAEGANVILTGRNPERLQRAASELGALSTAAFDATDPVRRRLRRHRCRHRSPAISSTTAAISSAPRFPSGASSNRPTSPHSPYTS